MNNRRAYLLYSISVMAGLVLGVIGASLFWLSFNAQFMTANLVHSTESQIITKEAVLEQLRAGRPEKAMSVLQSLLDGDFISAAALARDGHELSAPTLRAVAKEMEARRLSGYAPPDAKVAAFIEELAAVAERAQQGAPADAPKAARR
jgi:hypothetical protein